MSSSSKVVLVTGGRDYWDKAKVWKEMDLINAGCDVKMVISGGATGADALAEEWAAERGIHTAVVKARWSAYGRRAGPMRNGAMMLLKPDLVVAFPGGSGTNGMCAIAEATGVTVVRISP